MTRSAVAQLVERRAVNSLVVGSNPTRGAVSINSRDFYHGYFAITAPAGESASDSTFVRIRSPIEHIS